MITIGIAGNSGAGKSTFSEMLLKDQKNVKVIHCDHLYDKIKKTLSHKSVSSYKRNNGENMYRLNKEGIIYKLAHLKCTKGFYDFLRIRYAQCAIKKEIEKAKITGIEYLIIDSIYLEELVDRGDLDFNIFIWSFPEIRRKRVLQREIKKEYILGKRYMVNNDLDFYNDYYDFVVENMESLEHLETKANIISNVIKNHEVLSLRR